MIRRLPALVLVGPLLLASCSSDEQAGPASAAATDDSVGAATADAESDGVEGTTPAPCTPARPAPAGQTAETITVEGAERSYLLDVPATYEGDEAVPLILDLHGSSSDARQQVAYSGLPAAAAEVGAIVVSLDGTGTPRGFGLSPASRDVPVITALLDVAEQRFCIDEDRIASTGISNGSATSAILACGLDGRLASVGLVAATVGPFDCDPDTRVAVIAFHGTGDQTVPYEGGDVETEGPADALGVRGAEEQIVEWAEQDGCSTEPEATAVADDVRLWQFPGCEAGTAVDFYRLEGVGHVWPGTSVPFDLLEDRLGPNTDSVVASELIVDFIATHPRQR